MALEVAHEIRGSQPVGDDANTIPSPMPYTPAQSRLSAFSAAEPGLADTKVQLSPPSPVRYRAPTLQLADIGFHGPDSISSQPSRGSIKHIQCAPSPPSQMTSVGLAGLIRSGADCCQVWPLSLVPNTTTRSAAALAEPAASAIHA